jgi:5-methylcytosine-specific restriction endonuclease McrA
VIKEIPECYDLMKENRLSFSAVLQVANVLNRDNKKELLPRIEMKSKSDIDKIIAEYQSPQVIPDQARPRLVKKAVTVPRAPAGASLKSASRRAARPELGQISLHSEGKNSPTVNNSTPRIEVVLERMFEIRFAADEELMELVRWMKSHLSHKFPKGANFQDVFKYAIKYLKDREDHVVQDKPRKSTARTDTRYISKATKQKVWKRDRGKCTFVGSNGERCKSDVSLQFDHYPIPFGRGGPSTVNNLRLLCAKHNHYSAAQVYGERHMAKFRRRE